MTKLRVKEICKEKGMTLAILAEKMGVSASAVSQYLKSDSISTATLVKFADVLGVKLDDLIVKDVASVNGFIEVNGTIHRVTRKEDIENVLKLL